MDPAHELFPIVVVVIVVEDESLFLLMASFDSVWFSIRNPFDRMCTENGVTGKEKEAARVFPDGENGRFPLLVNRVSNVVNHFPKLQNLI